MQVFVSGSEFDRSCFLNPQLQTLEQFPIALLALGEPNQQWWPWEAGAGQLQELSLLPARALSCKVGQEAAWVGCW